MSPLARAWENPLENPVVYRTIASELTGRRAAVTAGSFHLVLGGTLTLFLALALCDVEWRAAYDLLGWGRCLHAVLQTATFGLLAISIPLRLSRLIDAMRRDGCFDEVVASGISPHRIAAGGGIIGLAYAVLLIATTIPYAMFCYLLGDVAVGEILVAYAAQLGYAIVIVLIALAASILGGIRAALATTFVVLALGVLASFGALGEPLIPAGLAWITPLRCFLGPFFTPTFLHRAFSPVVKLEFLRPALYLEEVPEWIYGPGLWILIASAALCLILAGPAHPFLPGLNSFGVASPGRRQKGPGRRRRIAPLVRRIEIAFLYRNLPLLLAPIAFRLRTMAIIIAFIAIELIGTGMAYHPDMLNGVTPRALARTLLLAVVTPVLLLDLALVQGAALRGRTERLGPIRASRGGWWDILFLLALTMSFIIAAVPLFFDPGFPGPRVSAPAAFRTQLIATFPWVFATAGLFLVILHLFSRALSMLVSLSSKLAMASWALAAVSLILPAGFLEPLWNADVGRAWVGGIIRLFPIPAVVIMSDVTARFRLFESPLLFPIPHLALFLVLLVLNILLEIRASRPGRPEVEYAT